MPEPLIAPVESRLIAEIRTKRGSARVMIALECGHLFSFRKKDIAEQQLAIGKPLDCGACGWMLSRKLYVGGNRSETFIRHIDSPIGDGDVRWMSWGLLDGRYVETGCCSTGRLSEWTIRDANERISPKSSNGKSVRHRDLILNSSTRKTWSECMPSL